MEVIGQCPVCHSQNVEKFRAGIAPFLQDRMFKSRGPKKCKFLHCRDCDFYFFDIRPDSKEMALFYEGYRNAAYQRQREKYEPLYTKELNTLIGKDPVERECRIASLEKIISENHIPTSIDILDYGGNDGCMIPPFFTGNKYCYDISGVQPVDGVQKIGDSELREQSYGLIMLSHVLEHISYPVEFLRDVTSLMGETSYLYIELPNDINILRAVEYSQAVMGGVKHILAGLRPRWVMPNKPYSMGPLMHEHINCFTVDSLREFIRISGLNCIDIGTAKLNFGWTEADILYCLARKI